MMSHRPTPYSIALAALISMHCEESSPLYMNTSSIEIDIDFHTVDTFLQGLVLNDDNTENNWSQIHDKRICVLVNRFHNSGVRIDISNRYVVWLRLVSSSIDTLTDIISNLRRCIADGIVDSASTNGIYIRSVCLGFDNLSFESTAKLWKDFYNEISNINVDGNDDDEDLVQQEWTFSSDQIEDSVRRHCVTKSVLSKNANNNNNIQQQLNHIIEYNPELPSTHFMRFLLCIDSGERVGAVDALHRYVDYVLINNTNTNTSLEDQNNNNNNGNNGNIDSTNTNNKTNNNNNQRNEEILQFAAILKAALHSSFGDRTLALASTEEAVRIAQQSQDSACVAFALGWLAMNAKSSNSSNSLELIKRCIHRATEANLCSLSAGANLTLASINHLQNNESNGQGGSNDGTSSWNTWSDSLSGDIVQSTDVESSRWDRPTNINHMNSLDEALEIIGRQTIVAAGIWDSHGQMSQSSISSLLSLYSNGKSLSSQDIRVAIQNIARRALIGSPSILCYKMSRERNNLYDQLQSLDHESNSTTTTTNIDDTICVYGDALRQMIGLCNGCNVTMNGSFSIEIALVVHEWAVRRGDLCQAEAIMQILYSELNSRIPNYDLVYIDIICQHALLRTRQGRYDEAKQMLTDQLNHVKRNNILKAKPQAVRLLLLLSLINLESSNNQQQCSTNSSTYGPLNECLAISKDNGMEGIYAIALSLFAQIYLQRGNYQRCIAIINAVLPTLLQQEHIWYQGEAYLTLGKCYLKRLKRYNSTSTDSTSTSTDHHVLKKIIKFVYQNLQRSEILFRRCHDIVRLREVYYLLARTSNTFLVDADDGDSYHMNQRNEASKRFAIVSQYLAEAAHQDGQHLVSSLNSPTELQKLAMRGMP